MTKFELEEVPNPECSHWQKEQHLKNLCNVVMQLNKDFLFKTPRVEEGERIVHRFQMPIMNIKKGIKYE